MKPKLKIEVVSDFVCPWCYVGKKRLERALELRPELDVDVDWLPFQLSPDMPREGRRRIDHYREIFGEARAGQIMASMKDTGAEEGIAFGDDEDAMSPNTLAAHALLRWAAEDSGVDEDSLAEALFAAHHVECRDLGDIEVLTELAEAAGMSGDEVRAKLTARDDEALVKHSIRESVGRGVSGVPFFIINEQYGLSGAQPPEVLADAFDRIVEATNSPA